MPITKIKIDKRIFNSVIFGTGDINVCEVKFEDNSLALALSQREYVIPIGTSDSKLKDSNDFSDDTIILKFDKVKSLDVVIKHLTILKEKILNGNN